VPLAAEETRDPKRDMPKGLIAGMGVLLVFAALMLVFAPGGSGSSAIMESGNPPVDALNDAGIGSGVTDFVNWVGLFGLVASFFSIIFAYSRQLFALSRAGYFPRALSVTSGRKVPWIALLLPALVGFFLAAFWEDQGARILNIAVFGAAVSYVLMMLSHIVLRSREPDLERGYRTPGGTKTSGVALVLAVLAVVATFLVDTTAAFITLGVYVVAALYFGVYSRHHLVAAAPEEEFAAIEKAEAELAGS
jgi:ethanolamine permease